MMKMQASITVALIALMSTMHFGVDAWGGLFNRFSPEMLSNLGYGGHGGYLSRSRLLQGPLSGGYGNSYGDSLEEESDDPCYEKKCTANEHCCPGSVCVNVDGVVGTCLFAYGLKQGELCRRDNDCETGLMCADIAGGETRSCQPPVTSNKQYNEECNMSGECDIGRGLCCQLQRRHRQTTRKVCSYFKDPLVCIGPVATDQIKSIVQYTSGEKRITGQGNRLFKRVPFA
ncbi:prohormone-3-like [Vespa mandarinia]|uniref:prohormone-3-like n=1 Tax=Vespa mandarinia TaxID=7446 RepID=UPI0016192015|nr:prohormone-3-like [Vespa mandarinia]XP_046832743.1 prohormone-3 [Vespa crabro]XP_047362093.1 prohormone-3 isoform X1 [Vespa velutina]